MPQRIRDQSRAGTLLLWGFALLWLVVSSPMVLLIPGEVRKGNALALAGLLFPIAGIGLLIAALRLTLRRMRFRESALVLDIAPVPLGGTLRGTVEVPHPLTAASAVSIRLMAMERRRRGKSTRDTIVCHEERELEPSLLRRSADGVVIPIEIAVPHDAPPSETINASRQVFWRLNVDADVPGIDYHAAFDVPVARTAFADFRQHGIAPSPIAAPQNPRSYIERQLPDGRELYFPPFRTPAAAFFSLLFTMMWLGAAGFMAYVGMPRFIAILLSIFGILFLASTLELFFESRTLLLGSHEIRVRRRMLSTTEKVIPIADIESARAVLMATSGGARPYYRIDIETKQGKRIKAVKNIRSKREAEWVAARIRR